MTTALIADDEEAPRSQLRLALSRVWPELRIVAEATNGIDAWDAFLEHEPDVCFLDVRMPGMSGLDVAQRVAGQARVVLVTAHGDHALAAFEAGAIDYVLKPVDEARLERTVAKLRAMRPEPAEPAPDLGVLMAQLDLRLRKEPPLEVIQAGAGKEVRLIRADEVIYFEADSRYTRVVHTGGEALIRTPLKELLARLEPARFWQVHRSIIVSHREIASAIRLDDGGMVLTLRGRSERLPVSRHFQNLFRGQ
ncbi:MAG: LytTR family DNA-binding domain-containing protein [Caldimonas sp.]